MMSHNDPIYKYMVKNMSTRSPEKYKTQLLEIIKHDQNELKVTEQKYRVARDKYFETKNILKDTIDTLEDTRDTLNETREILDKLKRKHSTVMNNIRLSMNTENGKRQRMNNELVVNYNGDEI